eukprot:Amastigsp_a339607_189.p3 type:complete len:101 gc:universal Amastigsp_a339607_189:448-750(+)
MVADCSRRACQHQRQRYCVPQGHRKLYMVTLLVHDANALVSQQRIDTRARFLRIPCGARRIHDLARGIIVCTSLRSAVLSLGRGRSAAAALADPCRVELQ